MCNFWLIVCHYCWLHVPPFLINILQEQKCSGWFVLFWKGLVLNGSFVDKLIHNNKSLKPLKINTIKTDITRITTNKLVRELFIVNSSWPELAILTWVTLTKQYSCIRPCKHLSTFFKNRIRNLLLYISSSFTATTRYDETCLVRRSNTIKIPWKESSKNEETDGDDGCERLAVGQGRPVKPNPAHSFSSHLHHPLAFNRDPRTPQSSWSTINLHNLISFD